MNWLDWTKDLPAGHVVARALFAGLVISIVTVAVLLAVREKAGHLTLVAVQDAWNAVQSWTLPW